MQKRIDTIRRIVAEVFGVEESILSDPGRSTSEHPAAAGQAYMWILWTYTDCTLFEAARWAGRRHHTTAWHASRRFSISEHRGDPYHALAKEAEKKVAEALSCE